MKKTQDQSFDAIMQKFSSNIYGSSKGKLRHKVLMHVLHKYINLKEKSLDIIDVGGGTGIMSQEMLSLGHKLTFNDLSGEAVELAKQNLIDFEHVEFHQSSLSELGFNHSFDLVICHAVLEWLNDPLAAIKKIIEMSGDGGFVSLSFFNKDAHRFGNILYGNFDYVEADMQNKNTVRLNPNRALSPRLVIDELERLNVEIVATAGVRCFHDYLKDREKQTSEYERIKSLELTYCEAEPYKWLGKYFHIIGKVSHSM